MEAQTVYIPVSVEDELPESGKVVFALDEKKSIKRNAFYVAEENKIVCEFEDYDDYTPDWLTLNDKTDTYYYKIGWYEELENSGTYDFIIYKRKITHWLKEQKLYCFTADELKALISDTYCEGYIDSTGHSETGIHTPVKDCIAQYIKSLNIK